MDVSVAPQTRPYLLAGLARARTIEHSSILEKAETPGICVWLKVVLHIGGDGYATISQEFLSHLVSTTFCPGTRAAPENE